MNANKLTYIIYILIIASIVWKVTSSYKPGNLIRSLVLKVNGK